MQTNFDIALEMAKEHNAAPFPVEEYKDRLRRIRAVMAENELDLVFLSSPEMMFYLTGFECEWYQAQSPAVSPPTSGVAVHVDHDDPILFESPREAILARLVAFPGCDVRSYPNTFVRNGQDFILEQLNAEGWIKPNARIGLELRNYRPNPVISEMFRQKLDAEGLANCDVTDLMAKVRRVKSQLEIEAHWEAARLTDIGLNAARDAIAPGVTELEVFGAMIHAMTKEGGEFPGILPPVCAGIRSNCLHPISSRREIQRGERVWVDCSGVFKRYHCNSARTYWVGDPPDDVVEFHNHTIGAFDIIKDMLAPGMKIRPMLDAIDDHYETTGVKKHIYWSGGYETGIAFPPDWVGSLLYDLFFTGEDDVFEPMTVVNHEANFYGPRGTGQSATIDAIIFEQDRASLCSHVPREIQVITP